MHPHTQKQHTRVHKHTHKPQEDPQDGPRQSPLQSRAAPRTASPSVLVTKELGDESIWGVRWLQGTRLHRPGLGGGVSWGHCWISAHRPCCGEPHVSHVCCYGERASPPHQVSSHCLLTPPHAARSQDNRCRNALLGADVHPAHDRMAQDPWIGNSPCPSAHHFPDGTRTP